MLKDSDKVKSLLDGKIYTIEKVDELNKVVWLEEISVLKIVISLGKYLANKKRASNLFRKKLADALLLFNFTKNW